MNRVNKFFSVWMTRETEGLKLDEKAPVPEKQGALEDAPQAEENKDSKDANDEEEKEEDKVYICLLHMLSDFNLF